MKRDRKPITPGQAADRILALKLEESAAAEAAAQEAATRVRNRYSEKITSLLQRSTDPQLTEKMIAAARRSGGEQ